MKEYLPSYNAPTFEENLIGKSFKDLISRRRSRWSVTSGDILNINQYDS